MSADRADPFDNAAAQQLRAAANAPFQGSGADIIKLAMVQLHQQQLLKVRNELVPEVALALEMGAGPVWMAAT